MRERGGRGSEGEGRGGREREGGNKGEGVRGRGGREGME